VGLRIGSSELYPVSGFRSGKAFAAEGGGRGLLDAPAVLDHFAQRWNSAERRKVPPSRILVLPAKTSTRTLNPTTFSPAGRFNSVPAAFVAKRRSLLKRPAIVLAAVITLFVACWGISFHNLQQF
jgi:hypothetical protein